MAIFGPVCWAFREWFAIPGFVVSPMLCLGVQDIERGEHMPEDFRSYATLGDMLRARGIRVDELDPFDHRAGLTWNLNQIPPRGVIDEKYAAVLDIGTTEHVFDTRSALENCARSALVGGYWAAHVPVRNCAGHGLHTYSPELVSLAMKENGFDVVSEFYTDQNGVRFDIALPDSVDVIGWYVGRKTRPLGVWCSPEQARYAQ